MRRDSSCVSWASSSSPWCWGGSGCGDVFTGSGGSVEGTLLHRCCRLRWCVLTVWAAWSGRPPTACGSFGEDYITPPGQGLPGGRWCGSTPHGPAGGHHDLKPHPHIIGGSWWWGGSSAGQGWGPFSSIGVSRDCYTVVMGVTVLIALAVLATGSSWTSSLPLVDPGVGWGGGKP